MFYIFSGCFLCVCFFARRSLFSILITYYFSFVFFSRSLALALSLCLFLSLLHTFSFEFLLCVKCNFKLTTLYGHGSTPVAVNLPLFSFNLGRTIKKICNRFVRSFSLSLCVCALLFALLLLLFVFVHRSFDTNSLYV